MKYSFVNKTLKDREAPVGGACVARGCDGRRLFEFTIGDETKVVRAEFGRVPGSVNPAVASRT